MNFSIHPRNHPNVKERRKKNTCSPKNPDKRQKSLRKASERLNRRRVSYAHTIKSLPSTVPESAYREPGSMKRKGNGD